jgi:amidohydrolase
MPDWQQTLDAIVADATPDLVALRRRLHANPEPSGAELQTSLALYQALDQPGLALRMGPDGCGVLADNRSAAPGLPRIAFRGDIDALLIHEANDVPYRSTRNGVMHACGHDAHAAIATHVALALHKLEASGAAPWPLRWRAILQPAEETAAGARSLIAAGALEGVSSIFALHVDPPRPTGEIGLCVGPFTANCNDVTIIVRGRGGHGARPHESRDPIAAAAQLVSSLYQFIPRTTDSFDAVVLSFGRIAGGQNANVIPEEVELDGTLRTLDDAVLARTIEQIHQIARGVEEITATQIEVRVDGGIPSVRNDAAANRILEEAAETTAGVIARVIPRPSMGGEDFACYLDHVPGAMFRLGIAAGDGIIRPLHTPTFNVNETALPLGVKILARAVILANEPAAAGA